MRGPGFGGLVLAVALAVGLGAEEPPARVIRVEGDALSVRLQKVPVAEVLDEVRRQTGAQLRGSLRAPRDVSAEFDAVPLAEALQRLLGTENFALVYGHAGELRAIKLLPGPSAPGTSGVAVAQTMTTTTLAQPGGPGLLVLLDRHLPIPLSGRLSQVLGTDTASIRQLLELGMHNDDPAVRAEAVRQSVQVLETEPDLRAGLMSTVNGMDEGQLSEMLRSLAGERAEELAMHIATQTRVTELRVKASSVLQKLRSGS